jgi:large subunit ribosomal protein L14
LSIQKAEPRKQTKKKDIHKAVVVRARQAFRRKDGSYVRFDENAVVLIDKTKGEPLGGRIFGPIPREIAERGYQSIASKASEIV